MSESSINTHSDGDILCVEVIGFLAADSRLFKVELSQVSQLVLDLKQATDISSMGVKSWIQWIQRMPSSCELVLKDCPHSIMNQVAVVTGFVPKNIRCESVLLPYYCDTCHKEKSVCYEQGKHYSRDSEDKIKINYPNELCERTDCKMTPDILEQKFEEFVAKLKL